MWATRTELRLLSAIHQYGWLEEAWAEVKERVLVETTQAMTITEYTESTTPNESGDEL